MELNNLGNRRDVSAEPIGRKFIPLILMSIEQSALADYSMRFEEPAPDLIRG